MDERPNSGFSAHDVEWTVIVAMVAVVMMEPTFDEVINVVAVRDRLMPAAGSMDMARLVTFVPIRRRAPGRVFDGHFNNMLLDIVPFLMVQMSLMEVVDMVAMLHGDMTAICIVMMRMLSVREMVPGRHEIFSFRSIECVRESGPLYW